MKTIALLVLPAIGIATPALAQSRSPIIHGAPPTIGVSAYHDRATADRPADAYLPIGQQRQARRWQRVGRCVVDRDRLGSLAYVQTASGPAAMRLKPVFGLCLRGAGIDVPASRPLRRAALADVLGAPLPS